MRFDWLGSVCEEVLFGYEIDVGVLGFEFSGGCGGFEVMALLVHEIVKLQCSQINWRLRLCFHSLFFNQNRTIRLTEVDEVEKHLGEEFAILGFGGSLFLDGEHPRDDFFDGGFAFSE